MIKKPRRKLGIEDWKRFEVRNKPKPLCSFELGKTPNVDKKSFVLVVNEFWDCVEVFFVLLVGIGLDWFCVVFVKRENVEFSKEMLSKFCKKPMFLFWL